MRYDVDVFFVFSEPPTPPPPSLTVYVVVQFYIWFKCYFLLFLGVVMYDKGGPLEKLWGGGEGNFRAAGIFVRYQIPCMNFFQALA